jgi:hypothetical protein
MNTKWQRRLGPLRIAAPDRERIRQELLERNRLRSEARLPQVPTDIDAEVERFHRIQVERAWERVRNGRYVSRVIRHAVYRYKQRNPGAHIGFMAGMMIQARVLSTIRTHFNEMVQGI